MAIRAIGTSGVRRRAAVALGTAAVLMVVAVVAVEALGPGALNAPATWQTDATLGVAIASWGLLVLDVVLPVPSSVLMTLNGAVFGVPIGALLSLTGATGSAAIAFAVGSRAVRGGDRPFGPTMARHGALAVAVTRPLPIAAELTAAAAGAAGMPVRRFLPAAACGAAITSLVYALAGRAVVDGDRAGMVIAALAAVAAVTWFGGRALTISRRGTQ